MAAAATDKFLKGVRRFSTTLASPGIANDTVQTATLDAATNLPTDTGCVITIDRVDSDGALTPNKEESVVGVISGSDITNMVRGFEGTAQAHAAGAVVEVRYLAAQHNRLIDGLLVQHNQDGTHKAATVTSLKATQTTTVAATDDASIVTPLAAAPYGNSSMARQAIMNGNFDVWQRGVTVAPPDAANTYLADRWADGIVKDSGTLPTLTRSRQALTPGDIPNAFYYTRLATNGAGTSLGVNSLGVMFQRIEHGTRLLCGLNKKVTLSFWARSDITNKRLTPTLGQYYGTGGTPTAIEYIKGTPITLTSTWTKYTVTFATNTLVGKTFGTDNNDYLDLTFYYMWGTTFGNSAVQTGVSAETFVGAGNIDIAQVQLCAGEVALPFQPKSFEDELTACLRYYQKSYPLGTAPGTATANGAVYHSVGSATTGGIYATISFQVPFRATPTVHAYDADGTVDTVYKGAHGKTASIPAGYASEKSVIIGTTDATSSVVLEFQWTAEAEL